MWILNFYFSFENYLFSFKILSISMEFNLVNWKKFKLKREVYVFPFFIFVLSVCVCGKSKRNHIENAIWKIIISIWFLLQKRTTTLSWKKVFENFVFIWVSTPQTNTHQFIQHFVPKVFLIHRCDRTFIVVLRHLVAKKKKTGKMLNECWKQNHDNKEST